MAKGNKPTYDTNLIEEIRKGLEDVTPVQKQKLTTPELINQLDDVLRQKLNDGCTWEQLASFLKDKGVDIKVPRLKTLLPKRPGGKNKRQPRKAKPSPADNSAGDGGTPDEHK